MPKGLDRTETDYTFHQKVCFLCILLLLHKNSFSFKRKRKVLLSAAKDSLKGVKKNEKGF